MGVQEVMHTCTALSPVQKYYSHLLPRSIIQEAQRWKHTNMSVITRSSFKRCIWSRMYTMWQWCMGPQSLAVVPEKYLKLIHFQVKNSAPSVKVGTSPLLFLREVSKYLGKGRPSQTRGIWYLCPLLPLAAVCSFLHSNLDTNIFIPVFSWIFNTWILMKLLGAEVGWLATLVQL